MIPTVVPTGAARLVRKFETLAAGIRSLGTRSVLRWMPVSTVLIRLTPVTDSAGPELAKAPTHTPLTPIFIGLRIGLHGIFVALTAFMVVRAILLAGPEAPWVIALGFVLLVAYLAGAFLARSATSPVGPRVWLAVLTVGILALLPLTPDATFLVFPLFFLQLPLLPFRWAIPVIVATTTFAIAVFAGHSGWTVGGVLGPVIGATVAIVIGLNTVGVILMSAMLVAPAAAARQWTHSLSRMILYSALFGAGAGLVGAIASVTQDGVPTGPAIVLCLGVIVLVSLLFGSAQGLVWDWLRRRKPVIGP